MATKSEEPVVRSTHHYCKDGEELEIIVEGLGEAYDGKLFYLREKIAKVNDEVSSAVGKSKNVLRIAKEEAVAAKVVSLLARMGSYIRSGFLGS